MNCCRDDCAPRGGTTPSAKTPVGSPRGRRQPGRRAGTALVLVLGVVAFALTLAYAMLRNQAHTAQVQTNAALRLSARQAAQAGLARALRRMHGGDWQGVDVPLVENLGAGVWFETTFATGDAALAASDPDYAEYPFRVTIRSTGFAQEPGTAGTQSRHTVEAVAQLIRRARQAQPAAFTALQSHTLTHWSGNTARAQFPLRVTGAVNLGGPLALCEDYPADPVIRERYLADLEAARAAGGADQRVFNGPVTLPASVNTWTTLALLQTALQVAVVDRAAGGGAPVSHPGAITGYRLYAGGKLYAPVNIQTAHGASLSSVTLAPDMITNPLGVFVTTGEVSVYSNVNIQGCLIAAGSVGDVQIYGANVTIADAPLPPLVGEAAPPRLPVLLAADDIRVRESASGSARGIALAWDEIEVRKRASAAAFAWQGRAAAAELFLDGRSDWDVDDGTWLGWHSAFVAQLGSPEAVPHFPLYLQGVAGWNPAPQITFAPDGAASYHWQNWSQPVYTALSSDGGLRWSLVRWRDVTANP